MISKRCYACKQEKPISQFYRSNVKYYQKECKDCCRERKYRWHQTENGKLSSANTKLKKRYGITLAGYAELLKKQNGKCKICTTPIEEIGERLAVDHRHEDGVIRGLLCKPCNVAIAHLKYNSELCVKAARYLEGLP